MVQKYCSAQLGVCSLATETGNRAAAESELLAFERRSHARYPSSRPLVRRRRRRWEAPRGDRAAAAVSRHQAS